MTIELTDSTAAALMAVVLLFCVALGLHLSVMLAQLWQARQAHSTDLCDECQAEFEEWLKRKEADD